MDKIAEIKQAIAVEVSANETGTVGGLSQEFMRLVRLLEREQCKIFDSLLAE